MRISAVVLALLVSSSGAIRLHAEPAAAAKPAASTAIDSKGRAKSESMPQFGGTATDSSKSGSMTHGEAKVNQKDLAHYKELSDVVLKNANTRQGSIHDHLSGKGLSPVTAKSLSAPGSAAPAGAFVPEGAKAVVEESADTVRKARNDEAKTHGNAPAEPTQTETQVKADAAAVAKDVAEHDKQLKENEAIIKKENAEKAKEKAAADAKLKADNEEEAAKAAAPPAEVAAPKAAAPPADAPEVSAAKGEAAAAEGKAKEAEGAAKGAADAAAAVKKANDTAAADEKKAAADAKAAAADEAKVKADEAAAAKDKEAAAADAKAAAAKPAAAAAKPAE